MLSSISSPSSIAKKRVTLAISYASFKSMSRKIFSSCSIFSLERMPGDYKAGSGLTFLFNRI